MLTMPKATQSNGTELLMFASLPLPPWCAETLALNVNPVVDLLVTAGAAKNPTELYDVLVMTGNTYFSRELAESLDVAEITQVAKSYGKSKVKTLRL